MIHQLGFIYRDFYDGNILISSTSSISPLSANINSLGLSQIHPENDRIYGIYHM